MSILALLTLIIGTVILAPPSIAEESLRSPNACFYPKEAISDQNHRLCELLIREKYLDERLKRKLILDTGLYYYRVNNYLMASYYLRMYYDNYDYNGVVVESLAHSYFSQGRISDTLILLIKASKIDSENPDLYLQMGACLDRLGDYRGALKHYDTAERLGANISWLSFNRAHAYKSLGNLVRAAEEYTLSIKFDPGRADTYTQRSIIYFNLLNFEASLADIDASLKIDSDNSENYVRRSINRLILFDTAGAIEDYEKAVELDPSLLNSSIVLYRLIDIIKHKTHI